MKALQYFSDEYLEQCRRMKPEQIVKYIESFQKLVHGKSRSKLISLKIPEALLNSFKAQAYLAGVPYQTQIKICMEEWVLGTQPRSR